MVINGWKLDNGVKTCTIKKTKSEKRFYSFSGLAVTSQISVVQHYSI